MLKIILCLFSLLLAPGLGLFAATHGLNEIVASNGLSSIEQVGVCCSQ